MSLHRDSDYLFTKSIGKERPQSITHTSTSRPCEHSNGFYDAITFKFLFITVRKRVFACEDCSSIMVVE